MSLLIFSFCFISLNISSFFKKKFCLPFYLLILLTFLPTFFNILFLLCLLTFCLFFFQSRLASLACLPFFCFISLNISYFLKKSSAYLFFTYLLTFFKNLFLLRLLTFCFFLQSRLSCLLTFFSASYPLISLLFLKKSSAYLFFTFLLTFF